VQARSQVEGQISAYYNAIAAAAAAASVKTVATRSPLPNPVRDRLLPLTR